MPDDETIRHPDADHLIPDPVDEVSVDDASAKRPRAMNAPAEAVPTDDRPAGDRPLGDAAVEHDPAEHPAVDVDQTGDDASDDARTDGPTGEKGIDDVAVSGVDARRATSVPAKVVDLDVDPGRPASLWTRTIDMLRRPRLTGAGMVIALLVGLLGFALIAQVKSNSNDSTLANDRPDDLVRILSDLDARKDRLSTEIAQLQETVRRLTSGAQGRQAALDEAAKRADELGILAGTLPAQGPGLNVTFQPQHHKIAANDVLNAVEELRGAGAEAMSVSGANGAVRIVASTYFTEADNGVDVGGQVLSGALTIAVIGDPQTMQTALNIPGGVVETVRSGGGNVTIKQPSLILVTALHHQDPMQYAQAAQ